MDWNRYAYSRNNPLYYTDPSGHIPIPVILAIVGIAIFMSQVPSDVYQSDPTRQGSAEIQLLGLSLLGPWADIGATSIECLSSGCDPVTASMSMLPGPSPVVVENALDDVGSTLSKQADQYPCGSFCMLDWTGYPNSVRQPDKDTVFRLLDGEEYDDARRMANNMNKRIRGNVPLIRTEKLEVHEVHPVKWGGDPTDLGNKILVPRTPTHRDLNNWWAAKQRQIERQMDR